MPPDSHVARRDAQQVVTSSAYILFYRRRSEHLPLGGPKVEELLAPASGGADSDEGPSRDPSPGAGEGRRLDDSSRNGLSGLGAVGAVHQSGVGGLASRSHDLSAEDETQQTLITTSEVADEGYHEGDESQYGPTWGNHPGWGFELLNSQGQQPHNSDNDEEMFGDTASQDSTRVAGGGSAAAEDDEPMFSDAPIIGPDEESESRLRSIRESAPPPDLVINPPMYGEDDDDEELPVAELHPGDDGKMDVSYTNQ